jgi:signal transduction histidine kinase
MCWVSRDLRSCLGQLASWPWQKPRSAFTKKTIEAKKVHLVKDLPESLTAQVHSGEILQLVSNLIANALDALPLEGTLWLKLRKRRDQVHLVVADNGHGISSELVDQVFQAFFTTKEDRGTGLGLSLSKKVVVHHRGKIRLRSSVRPGKSGTVFKISLPA